MVSGTDAGAKSLTISWWSNKERVHETLQPHKNIKTPYTDRTLGLALEGQAQGQPDRAAVVDILLTEAVEEPPEIVSSQ